jgi:two-component system, NtrC family, sensor kinase
MKRLLKTTSLFASLGFRLGAMMGLALAVGLGTFLYFSMAHHEHALLAIKREEANLLSDTIENSLTYSMLQGEEGRAAIHKVIAEIGGRDEIERVRIYNAVGDIQYSSNPIEKGRSVDKDAENCKHCHSGSQPLKPEAFVDRSRFFYTPESSSDGAHRVLGVINPIYNDKAKRCDRCHESGKTVLGVLDVVVSLARLDADIVSHRRALAIFGILGVGLFMGVVALFIHFFVHRPVNLLLDGTQKVGLLDLDYQIPEQRRDELGCLARAFNLMTERLSRAREEIRDFADHLEAKVREKTAELERAQGQMVRSEKMAAIGQMAAGVAHEINNPLTGVITFAHLLKKSIPKGGREEEDLKTIIGEAERCSRIVRGLLDFARGGEIVRKSIDVTDVLEKTLALMEYQASFHNITVERAYTENLPEIEADQDQVQQIFVNLIANAAEAMCGDGRLTLATSKVDEVGPNGPGVCVRVADTGPGIDPEDLKRVFDPFFSTKETGEGTGLGLSVTYRIVENHGGRITVSSQPGGGAEFVVALPVKTVREKA